METIEQIYHKAKLKCPIPVGIEAYIVIDENKVHQFHSLMLDFHEEAIPDSVKKMKDVSKKEGFYAFVHSEKGEEFIEKNKMKIAQAWTNMVLCNAGYGEKICKN